MKKKIELCSAVLHKPDILILDEPFAGLDPIMANQLCEFLLKYQNGNRIIFVSSHNLNFVSKIASNIGVLNNAKIVFDGTIKEFNENGNKKLDDSLFELLAEKTSFEELRWML